MLTRLLRSKDGGVAPLLALSLVPIMGTVAAAVDYSRAAASKASMQAALDSALLYATKDGNSDWAQRADAAFKALVTSKDAEILSASFNVDANGHYAGSVSAKVPLKLAGLLGMQDVTVMAASAVKPAGDSDNSCILTLDRNASLSHVSMVFNGAPDIRFNACSLRSNTSMQCNGHSGGAARSWASGTSSGCGNPSSYVPALPDIYADSGKNIKRLCGAIAGSVTWTPSVLPSTIKVTSEATHKEFHVCGSLTLEGIGKLAGLQAGDNVIVVENGSITLAADAQIELPATTIVLTGAGNTAGSLQFPNGAGQRAQLAVTPPTDNKNPWRGIAIYQDPALTTLVSNDWGPGAALKVDGVIYMAGSDIEMRGNASSNAGRCTKIVANTFRTNGGVTLNFEQDKDACERIGMNQWSDIPQHLVR